MGYEIIPGHIAVTNRRMSSKNTREETLETEEPFVKSRMAQKTERAWISFLTSRSLTLLRLVFISIVSYMKEMWAVIGTDTKTP